MLGGVRSSFGVSVWSSLLGSTKCFSSQSRVRVVRSPTFDPFMNLATEDWLFREADPKIQTLFLWRNAPTVVIGRNQNPWKECNLQKMDNEGIHLVRRVSGGGAVYHDLGTTIFSFFSTRENHDKNRNLSILCNAISQFGIEAQPSGRNDVAVDSLKVSGSAYKFGKGALHHGTVLVNTDLDKLSSILNVNKEKLKSKGVTSVRKRVLNLQERNKQIDHDSLSAALITEFCKAYNEAKCQVEDLDLKTLEQIPSLIDCYKALKDWKWRFGETPEFEHNLETRFEWGVVDVYINSKEGLIVDCRIFSDSLYPDMIDSLATELKARPYNSEGIKQATQQVKLLFADDPNLQQYLEEFAEWLSKVI